MGTQALALEIPLEGRVELEKNGIQEQGSFQSYSRLSFGDHEQYDRLEDELITYFKDAPVRSTAEFAVQELAMNTYKYNGKRGVVEFLEYERCLLVLVHGSAHDPRTGHRTPEDRGFDAQNPHNGWINNGRKKEYADGAPDAFSWGDPIAFMNSDLYGYTEDGRVKVLGFNKLQQ